MARNSTAAARIDDLHPDAAFLVRSIRLWAVGKRDGSIAAWASVWQLFHALLAEEQAAEAVSRFQAMVGAINGAARRVIHHHTPGCPCLDADEIAIVRLVAESGHGAAEEARAIAGELVRPEAVEALTAAAHGLARCLAAGGHAPPAGTAASRGRWAPTAASSPRPRFLH